METKKLHGFSLIVTDPCRLPSALTAVALRIEKFTITKMSTCRWLIELPTLTQSQTNELLEAIPPHVADVHLVD